MPVKQLERVEAFLRRLNRRVIEQNNDRVILVIGDEGSGKSTFMLQVGYLWQQIRERNPTPDSVLDQVVWGENEELRELLLESEPGSCIPVQDAAHALLKKESMDPEQIDLEKSFLDIRIENYLILLGYQDWDHIPTFLQRRRAENAFVIPSTGQVRGFSRSSMDQRFDDGEWPDPDFRDEFPDLEGTELWERFEEIDAEKKRDRLKIDDGEGDAGPTPQAVVDEIIDSNSVGEYVDTNDYNGQSYISKPLILLDYPELSKPEADQVKHGLRRETDVLDDDSATNPQGEGEGAHT